MGRTLPCRGDGAGDGRDSGVDGDGMSETKRTAYRFIIEPLDNGWFVKISEPGSDKLVARWAFNSTAEMLAWLSLRLEPK